MTNDPKEKGFSIGDDKDKVLESILYTLLIDLCIAVLYLIVFSVLKTYCDKGPRPDAAASA